jgi:hypothetical protein
MPRFAIGDLLLDLEVPASFTCDYSLSGSLVAAAEDGPIEVSALHVSALAEGAETDLRSRAGREDETTFIAAFHEWLIIATHAPQLASSAEHLLSTVAFTHQPFEGGDEVQTRPLAPSHDAWFRQRRRSLQLAFGFDPSAPHAARALDDFWEAQLIDDPPDDEHQLNTMLICVSVGFGDLLRGVGFEWCLAKDEYGTSLGMMALPDTARMLVVPESFVGKRWERREGRFFEDALAAIAQTVGEVASEE